jgi:4-amino-4-deoxy-L-arabinose transferase-like glycosyltransferase
VQLAQQSRYSRNWVTDLLCLCAVYSIFYFLWLGSYPYFTPDEGRYSEVAREMLATGDFITPRVNGIAFLDKPVLYYWLQAAAMKLFGVNEWAVRFFPALFGIFGCLVVYAAGRRLFGRVAGLLASLILAVTPLYYGGSHYANLDLEVAVLISTSLLAFLTAAESQGRTRNILFMLAFVFAGLSFLTKGLIAIAFPAIIGGLWILLLSRWRLLLAMRPVIGILILAAIILPWFVLVQRANPAFLHFFFVTQQVTRFLSSGVFNNPSPLYFYVPVILAGFIPWTAFLAQAFVSAARNIWQDRSKHAAELFLVLWAVIIFVFFSIPHSKTVSYILRVFPAIALLTGKYLADAWQSSHAPYLGIKIGIGLLIVINTLFAVLFFALQYRWMDLSLALTPTLFAVGIELAASALCVLFLSSRLRTPLIFAICTLTSTAMLLTFALGAEHMNPNSAKPLIQPLLARLKPTDVVVNYFKFYQDVPLYLDRTLILVADWQSKDIPARDNWVREFWYSMPFQNTDNILLNEKAFWKRWHSGEKIYVFVNQNYFKQFRSHTRKYEFIAQHNDIILLGNHPAG